MKNRFFSLILLILTMLGCLCVSGIFYAIKYPVKYESVVQAEAEESGVSKALVMAIIKVESNFDPNAKSSRGAIGLMQLMPQTAKMLAQMSGESLSDDDLFDPQINIKYGCKYLQYLSKTYTETELLAAYNAGPARVKTWLSAPRYSPDGIHLTQIPYPETARYVKKVKSAQKHYAFAVKD